MTRVRGGDAPIFVTRVRGHHNLSRRNPGFYKGPSIKDVRSLGGRGGPASGHIRTGGEGGLTKCGQSAKLKRGGGYH